MKVLTIAGKKVGIEIGVAVVLYGVSWHGGDVWIKTNSIDQIVVGSVSRAHLMITIGSPSGSWSFEVFPKIPHDFLEFIALLQNLEKVTGLEGLTSQYYQELQDLYEQALRASNGTA